MQDKRQAEKLIRAILEPAKVSISYVTSIELGDGLRSRVVVDGWEDPRRVARLLKGLASAGGSVTPLSDGVAFEVKWQ